MAESGMRAPGTSLSRVRIGRKTEFLARVVVVLSLIAGFDIAFPDLNRTIARSDAAAIEQSGLLVAVDAADTGSYSGSGTTWTDLSGNSKNGTLTSAVVTSSTSSAPRMLTTGSGKYASFPSGFSDFTSGITVQATLDFGSADSWERIIDFASDYNGGSFVAGDGDSSNNILFARGATTTDLILQFYAPRGSGILGECKAAGGITSGVHNYAVTVAPSAGGTTCTLYRDGVALSSSNTLSRMPDNVTRTANFAAHSNWTGDTDLAGSYKSLFIYNRALSSSEISSNYTADRTPLAPSGLTSTSMTQTSAALSWTAPTSSGASSITDYVVEYSTDNTAWSTFADGTSTATTATVTGLSASSSYYFRVSAKNSTLTGPVSSSIQRTTNSPYTTTFDSRGGSATSSITWTSGQSITLPAAPTRAGYTFNGWSTKAAGSTLVYQTTTPTRDGSGAIVYTSGYGKGPSDAAATLKNQGATFEQVRYRMEAKYNSSATPYYADVTFDKWAGATIDLLAIPDEVDNRIIKSNVSNMTVDSNWPGFASAATAVNTGSGKTGRLEIWYSNYSQGTTGITPAGDGLIFDSDDTATGSNTNYGSFQVHDVTDAANLRTVLAWNRHFVGNTNPDVGFGNNLKSCQGGYHTDWTFCQKTNFDLSSSSWKLQIYIGDLFAGGATYTPASNADFTLYAQWTPNTLNVTYDSQGGSAISGGTTVTGGSIASSPGTPTRAGYTFNGWFAAASGGSAISFPYSHPNTANFNLYAQWTANTLNVTYDSQGGSAISGGTTVTGGSIASSPGTPTKGTDVFRGWFAASSGGSAITFPYTHGKTANFTLYAQWQTDQSALSITGAPGTLAYQGSVTLGTSGGSGTGAVTYATSSPSICSVNADTGVVSMLAGAGSCGLTATRAADANYKAAYGSATITAVPANQSALTITGSASGTYGATVNLSTSGGSSTGAVTWSAGSSTACSVNSSGVVSITSGTGTCSVTATKAADTNYNSVTSSAQSITVSKANQTTLTVTSTEVDYGDTLALVASGGNGGGALTWTKVSGTCSVSGASLTPGTAGSACVVKVTKATDSNYSVKSSADTTITVNKAAQTGFRITGSTSFNTGATLVLSTTGGQSAGSVTWAVTTGTCTLSGSTVSSTRGGITCVVEATKGSDSNYLSATDSLSVTVNKIAQTLTFRSTAPSPAIVGGTYTVTVDSDAFLAPTISIANTSASVCTVAAGVVTFNSAGTCLISASQSGNDAYASAAASQSVTVAAAATQNTAPVASAPTTTTATATQGAGVTTTTVSALAAQVTGTTTTVPGNNATAAKPAVVTTTTSTTTTTIPADPSQPQTGADGKAPALKAGEATALVRGELVKVNVEQVDNAIVYTLPNKVKVAFGPSSPQSKSVRVAADGVLRMYRTEFVDVAASGLVPGTTYTVYMFSTPVELGRGVADADGNVVATVQIPKNVETRDHTLQVNGVGPGGEVVTTSIGITVLKKTSSTGITVLALTLAILLALLGGRPMYVGRRRSRRA